MYTTLPERSSFTDIAVTPDYLYLATTRQGLRVLSLADPARPVEVGSFAPSLYDELSSVTLGPGYLLVTAQHDGLLALSLADPAHPAKIGAFSWFNDDPDLSWSPYAVSLSGRYAYVTARLRSGIDGYLFIVDLIDPAHPTPVAQNELRVDSNDLFGVSAGYGYLGSFEGALTIVDLRDPATITRTATLELQNDTGALMPVWSGAWFGRYAYLGTEDGLRVVDVLDPAAPAEVGAALDGISVRDLAIQGRYLYAAAKNGLFVLTNGLTLDHQLYLSAVTTD